MLDRIFRISERGSSLRAELLGGATTFMTMAYIIVVNPAILSLAGIPVGPCTMATILAAAFGCVLMALYANLPIAVAPYMGENAFIAIGLTSMGIAWPTCLGAVFVSGALFLVLSLLGVRQWLANSISASMKYAFASGIGLFLTAVGIYQTGIVTSAVKGMHPQALLSPGATTLNAPDVPLKLGNFHDPHVLLALFGFFLIMLFMYRRMPGAILVGMAVTAALGYCLGLGKAPPAVAIIPFTGQYDLSGLAFKLDILGTLQLSFLPILLTLLMMSFLDTIACLMGLGAAADMLDEKGNFPQVERPMIVDALSCMFSPVAGSSTTGAFIESATGIREGARTGLAALTVAVLFLVSLFFVPLLEPLQSLSYAYAPALMAVGFVMVESIKRVDLQDMTEAVPAFASIIMMLFTFNIANGMTAGLTLYALFKLASGRHKELNSGSLVLGGLCLLYYVFGLPH